MNPDSPIDPRSALEASLTALLLGELPHDQAAALHQKLAQDAELAALYERLKHTIALVRETVASPAQQTAQQPAPLKLSDQRRQKLLQQFKTVAPKQFVQPRRRAMPWLVPAAIAAAVVVVLGALFLPVLGKSKSRGQLYSLNTWSLSKRAESPAPSTPYLGTTKNYFAPGEDGRAEQLALRKELRRQSGGGTASSGESPNRAKSAGAAIVLPKAGQPDDATTAARVKYRGQPESGAAGTVRGYSDDSSGPSGGAGGAATFGGFAANTRGRDTAGAEGQPAKGAVMDDFFSRRERLGATAPAGGVTGVGETRQVPERYAAPVVADNASSTLEFQPHSISQPAAPPPSSPPVTRSLGEERLGLFDSKNSAPAPALALTEGAPADGVEVARVPLQMHDTDQAAGDLFAAAKKRVAGLQPAEVAKSDESFGRADVTWSEASKQGLDAPAIEARLKAGADAKAAKEAEPRITLEGITTLNKPPSREPIVTFALRQSKPAPAFKGTPKDVAPEPAAPLPQAAPAPPVEEPVFGVGEGLMVKRSGSAGPQAWTRSFTVGNDPEVAGVPMQTQAGFALADTARAVRAPAPGATSDFSTINGDAQNLNYAWHYDTSKDRGLAKADGDKAPILGDLPDAARFYRLQPGSAAGGRPASAATDRTHAMNSLQEGVDPNSITEGEPLAIGPAPAGSINQTRVFAKFSEGPTPARPGKTGHGEDGVSAGALSIKTEEKVKSFELADLTEQERHKIRALDTTAGQQNLERGVYSLDVVGHATAPAQSAEVLNRGNIEITRRSGSSIALPKAGVTELALKDSSGADQNGRHLREGEQRQEEARNRKVSAASQSDVTPAKPAAPAPVPQPELSTSDNPFSTFSLNVSDVSWKLAGASLEKGTMPEPATVRSEEFINALDYRDPEPSAGVPVAFAWERAQYPFAQNRDLLRFSIKTAAQGRQAGRPLNLVLLLDNSGSMERADRVQTIREALRVLAGKLQAQDKLSVIACSRTARLWVDGVPGDQAAKVADEVGGLTPQGGTNLEEAMNLAYQTALRHYLAGGINRVVLLTDGAANLGNVEPEALKAKVEANRKQGIALDCFGIGWEGYNDDLLEVLSRNGDGRYGFINTPEEAATEFAGQLAGALQVAASDVKVQVEFNPARVKAYRQIGYAKHQLTKEQFRDNTVDAAEIGAAESGNALYVVEVNPSGQGPLATVRVRFKVPGTSDYREHEWAVPYTANAVPLEQATPAMRLAATASAFSEWLSSSPYAAEVTPDRLLSYLSGVPEVYGADARPKKLEWMIRQAKSLAGK
jgi:Mg-chelatase subunit ChlD